MKYLCARCYFLSLKILTRISQLFWKCVLIIWAHSQIAPAATPRRGRRTHLRVLPWQLASLKMNITFPFLPKNKSRGREMAWTGFACLFVRMCNMQLLRFRGDLAAIERELIRVFFYLLVFVCLVFISFFFLQSKWHHGLWWKPVGAVLKDPHNQPWIRIEEGN